MKFGLLLRTMIAKELRTTLRERHQLVGIVISVVVLVGVVVSISYNAARQGRTARQDTSEAPNAVTDPSSRPAPATSPGPTEEQSPFARGSVVMAVRWAAIAVGAGIGLFFSLGYVIAGVVASFAGEKEARTLEILLASPIPDTTLFLAKCLSVLIPMVAVGYALLLAPAAIGLYLLRDQLRQAPINIPLHLLVLSVPLLIIVQTVIVSIGAAVSAKAETVKGASQSMGVVFFIVFFGMGYGGPLLARYGPFREALVPFLKWWLGMPFVVQYLLAMILLLIPAAISFAIGRMFFQRDKLLT